jgi:hypothetical protein
MATEREAQSNLAPFHKFTELGQAIAGKIERMGQTENGAFAIFHPVIGRSERGGSWTKLSEIAIGLTTDLSMKVERRDVGKYVFLEFNDTEPTRKGNDKKLFRVIELTRDEIIGLRDGTFSIADAVAKPKIDRSLDRDDF